MSQPKRFALPYEPEYTAHRTDRRIRQTTRLHRALREHPAAPSLVPDHFDFERAKGASAQDQARYAQSRRQAAASHR